MASLVAKKKANTLYYYVVESARVDGRPRIVHQTYLGTAERVAALIKDRTAPLPLSATTIAFGLPGALWLAAQNSGVFPLLESLWPKPRGCLTVLGITTWDHAVGFCRVEPVAEGCLQRGEGRMNA
jgi:hypothetical protein